MIYFLGGLSVRNNKLDDLSKQYLNISFYDAKKEEEYEKFKIDVENVSFFDNSSLYVLKNCNNLKNIDSLIEFLKNIKEKDIVIDYEYLYKNQIVKKFEKIDAQIYEYLDSKSIIKQYIGDNLNIDDENINKLIDFLSDDFNYIKNEVFKIKSLIGDKKFEFQEVKEFINQNENKKIYEYVSEILEKKECDIKKINSSYYSAILSLIQKELITIYMLNCLNLSKVHDEFKKQYQEVEDIFGENYYKLFLKYTKQYKDYNKKNSYRLIKKAIDLENQFKTGLITDKLALNLFIAELKNNG